MTQSKLSATPTTLPIAFSIKSAAAHSGIATFSIRGAIHAGKLPARLVGKRLIILADDMKRWLEELPETRNAKVVNTGSLKRRKASSSINNVTM